MHQKHQKSPEDIVICGAVRTPLQRARKGAFKDTCPEELLSACLKGLIKKTGVNPDVVQDICVGTVLTPGGGATLSRMAAFHAGFPETTCVYTVNRQCSSGLQAVASIVDAISNNRIEAGIGAGFESMSLYYGPSAMPSQMSPVVLECQEAQDCLLPMGITSENVASQFTVPRSEQDAFAALSHQKALRAQKLGLFDAEIIPVNVNINAEDGSTRQQCVSSDDGPRLTSVEILQKLKPAFAKNGVTTAGNSSQVTDGAAAVLLMKRKYAEALNVPVLARFVAFDVCGVSPSIMGIGPAKAIPLALQKANLQLSDIDIFEINEAFASQALYCVKALGIDIGKVNPKGGAIALGHPLGCTGARQIATMLPEMKRTNSQYGVVSMCIGTGMGAAAIIENEQVIKANF